MGHDERVMHTVNLSFLHECAVEGSFDAFLSVSLWCSSSSNLMNIDVTRKVELVCVIQGLLLGGSIPTFAVIA